MGIIAPAVTKVRAELAGQAVAGLSVPVREGRSLRVTLRGTASERPESPCPEHAQVTLVPLDAWGAAVGRSAEIGFAEDATIDQLAPGKYRLEVAGPGEGCYLRKDVVVDVSEGTDSGPVSIVVTPGGTVRGRLVGGPGGSSDFTIALWRYGIDDTNPTPPARITLPDAALRFEFKDLPPGHYRIAVQRAGDVSVGPTAADGERAAELEVISGVRTEVDLPVPVGGVQSGVHQ